VSKTHYEVLGVAPSATATELHERFKELALAHHPDKFKAGSAKQADATVTFAAITEAYAVLKDEKRRAEYDAKLKLTRKFCARCSGEGQIYITKGFTRRVAKTCSACNGRGYVEG
jgi:DnaJ-class molecular chaperone